MHIIWAPGLTFYPKEASNILSEKLRQGTIAKKIKDNHNNNNIYRISLVILAYYSRKYNFYTIINAFVDQNTYDHIMLRYGRHVKRMQQFENCMHNILKSNYT